MIIGIGTDLVEVDRIRGSVERADGRFLKKVYTEGELQYCHGKVREYEHLAGRFAAKEAVLKALGTGIERESSLRDVEVCAGPNGRPTVTLHGATRQKANELKITHILLSITHTDTHAIAFAVAEG